MKLSATFPLVALLLSSLSVRAYDIDRPEGWATCPSVSSAGDYDLTGGGNGSLIVLRSNGGDMRQTILDAVNSHDVIVLDGKDGPFEISKQMDFLSLSGKTLVGVNGARLYTTFYVTDEIRNLLDELNVKSLSSNPSDNLGGTLSNGSYVNEQCELTIRQALIDYFGDPKEPYRYSGIFNFMGCSNIIVRNLDFVGPGSLDVGGADLMTLNACDHVWVDHCRFTDGMDGNLDIVNNSDFVTVGDAHFRYTDRSYNHPLSNLNSGIEITDGSPQKNNISWIRCYWDDGCTGRMPLTDLGIHHLLNCYWDNTSGTCIDAHKGSRLLIENSYFTSRVKKALAVRDEDVVYEWRQSYWQNKTAPVSTGEVSVPYEYTATDVMRVPFVIKEAGATLTDPYSRSLASAPECLDFGKVYANTSVDGIFNISSFGSDTPSSVTISAPEGILLTLNPDDEYASSLTVSATDENLLQADIFVKATFAKAGTLERAIEVKGTDRSFTIPVKAEVIGLGGERIEASIVWPLVDAVSGPVNGSASRPDLFSSATLSLGEKIVFNSTKRVSDKQFATFNPTEEITRIVDEDCCITFDVVTAPGYIFVPKRLSFKASRMGTDMCYLDVDCSRDEGTAQNLLKGFQPPRSSESPAYADVSLPLGAAGVGDSLRIKLYLYYMYATKQLALADVRIEGDIYTADSALREILAEGRGGEVRYYDMSGTLVAHPQSGRPYLVCGGGERPRVVILY